MDLLLVYVEHVGIAQYLVGVLDPWIGVLPLCHIDGITVCIQSVALLIHLDLCFAVSIIRCKIVNVPALRAPIRSLLYVIDLTMQVRGDKHRISPW